MGATRMKTGKYVDGFVISIPKKNTAKYKKMAREAKEVWMKFGALDYKECSGDDLHPDTGGSPIFPFPKMAKTKEDENVWFSFIVYNNKAHRNSVNKKVMKYYSEKYGDDMEMPFDMKRFSYGGFKVEVGF
jgi:uncharacterized protein YbaA (DUF1428 family)